MEEKVLIFKDTRHQEAFREALEKASLGRAVTQPDHGWPKPALRVWGGEPLARPGRVHLDGLRARGGAGVGLPPFFALEGRPYPSGVFV